ncbi:restriction endonuclease subunit S [Persicobacter sp. CCB-QB2]|uniref:restriction endonuclease subunit S n=1 Tax=Persicobacter sp. CCB-QB2 TaxID=1561025 RepID=UPI00155D891C|nr:restriction endonuclease subunit S [Persicobacter sp. CCB-QB2]
MIELQEICTKITDGSHNPPKGIEEGLLMLSSRNINANGLVLDDVRYLSEQDFNTENKRTDVKVGDVLLTIVGSIGRVLVVNESHPKFTLQRSVGVLKPNKELITPSYLGYILRSTPIQIKLNEGAKGVAQKGIYLKDIRKIKIPLPPLPIQKRIATILDEADRLRQLDAAMLKKYDQLTQSLFLEMFGDPVTNPKGWEKKTCGDFISYLADVGSNGSNKTVAEKLQMTDKEDYAIMVRTMNFTKNDFTKNIKYVSEEVYNFFSKTKVYGGEIIMNKIGSAGEFWIMPQLNKPVSLGLNQFVIRLTDINLFYFYYFLSTNYGQINIKSKLNGATTKSITKTAVRELPILSPLSPFKTNLRSE